jgi:hypothetical protein
MPFVFRDRQGLHRPQSLPGFSVFPIPPSNFLRLLLAQAIQPSYLVRETTRRSK